MSDFIDSAIDTGIPDNHKDIVEEYVAANPEKFPWGVLDPKIGTLNLYGAEDVSTVRDRAQYIYEQLQLPDDQRLMRVPELDEKQRMYKP